MEVAVVGVVVTIITLASVQQIVAVVVDPKQLVIRGGVRHWVEVVLLRRWNSKSCCDEHKS
jgi:hypothetical protein